MAYPNFTQSFTLHIDTSYDSLGAILFQQVHDEIRVIGHASRTLRSAESNYHSTKLELLSLKWSITDAFRDYQYHAQSFTVFSDNNHVTHLLTQPRLNGTAQ